MIWNTAFFWNAFKLVINSLNIEEIKQIESNRKTEAFLRRGGQHAFSPENQSGQACYSVHASSEQHEMIQPGRAWRIVLAPSWLQGPCLRFSLRKQN